MSDFLKKWIRYICRTHCQQSFQLYCYPLLSVIPRDSPNNAFENSICHPHRLTTLELFDYTRFNDNILILHSTYQSKTLHFRVRHCQWILHQSVISVMEILIIEAKIW